MIIDLLKEAYTVVKERRKQKKISKMWFDAALAYNTLHTYSSRTDGEWMCPMCHTIHPAGNFSPFTGIQYPKCCDYPEGHRIDKDYATDINFNMFDKPTERYKL